MWAGTAPGSLVTVLTSLFNSRIFSRKQDGPWWDTGCSCCGVGNGRKCWSPSQTPLWHQSAPGRSSLAVPPPRAGVPPWLLQLWGSLWPLLSDHGEPRASGLLNSGDSMVGMEPHSGLSFAVPASVSLLVLGGVTHGMFSHVILRAEPALAASCSAEPLLRGMKQTQTCPLLWRVKARQVCLWNVVFLVFLELPVLRLLLFVFQHKAVLPRAAQHRE